MPIGSALGRRRQNGFTYLLLLFALAMGGIGLAALGEQARLRSQRERETELMFRGSEIARAIASYVQASPGASRALPVSLADLLEDRRSGRPVRHLRRPYADPLVTPLNPPGAAAPESPVGWVLLAPSGQGCSTGTDSPTRSQAITGFSAVRSSSPRPLLRRSGGTPKLACDLVFRYQDFLGAPPPLIPTGAPQAGDA